MAYTWDKTTWGKGQTFIESKLNDLEKTSKNSYSSISKIDKENDYLYEVTYSNIDYQKLYEYSLNNYPGVIGGCSSVRKGNWYGRNLDWTYDDIVNFVVKVPAIETRHASIGIGQANALTTDTVSSGVYNDAYDILPFLVVDGLNDSGVVINHNVVHISDNPSPTTGIIGSADKPLITTNSVVRWVLDHYDSAWAAVQGLQNDIRVFIHPTLRSLGFESHWMIADATETYIVEIYNGEWKYTKYGTDRDEDSGSCPAMYNFYRYDVEYNTDGSLCTPATSPTGKGTEQNNLGKYSAGLERSNIVNAKYDVLEESFNGFKNLMLGNDGLKYSNTYATPLTWYSEFVESLDNNGNKLTIDNTTTDYDSSTTVIEEWTACREALENKNRHSETKAWTSRHTSIVDLQNKEFYVLSEENIDKYYKYTFNDNYTRIPAPALKIGNTELTEAQLKQLLELIVNK